MNHDHAGQTREPDDFEPPHGTGQAPVGRDDSAASPGYGDTQQWQPTTSPTPAGRSYYDNGPGLYGSYSVQPAKNGIGVAAIIIIVVAISFILFTIVAIFAAFFLIL